MASVPGSHRGPDYDKWGHRRLGHLLKKHVTIPSLLSPSESKESWPIIAQCSSIGALGADPDAWMCGELRTSMSQRAVQPGDMPQPPPKFKVVSSFVCRTSSFLPQVFGFFILAYCSSDMAPRLKGNVCKPEVKCHEVFGISASLLLFITIICTIFSDLSESAQCKEQP